MKFLISIICLISIVLPCSGILISNEVPSGTSGYYAVDIGDGARSNNGWIGTGTNYGNVEFIYDYYPYYSIAGDKGILFSGSTVEIGTNILQTTGRIAGQNGIIDFRCVSCIPAGTMLLIQSWTFTSSNSFGNFRFIQYLDEDVLGVSDDVLIPLGSYFNANLELYTVDATTRIGTFQSVSTNDERNVDWVGWSADEYSELKTAIQNGVVMFDPDGLIETNSLPPIPGTSPREYGPEDVTSAVAYDLQSNATHAVLTVVLGGSSDVKLPADAIKILKFKAADKGPGKSAFTLVAGYNWSGKLPITEVGLTYGSMTSTLPLTAKGKNYAYKDSQYALKVIPKKHRLIAKAKKIDPVTAAAGDPLTIDLVNTGAEFEESRDITLQKGKYKETKNLTVPLFYVDKAKIKDTGKDKKDKVGIMATLNGTAPGTGSGVKITLSGDGGEVLTTTIPAASFSAKKTNLIFKRPKGDPSPVKMVSISTKKKTAKILLDSFNIPPAAISTMPDPLIGIKVSVDFPQLSGGGSVSVRFIQKKPGKLQF